MSRFPMEAAVKVRPYSSRREDDFAVIGDDQRQVYLSIPSEGLDLLEWLRDGATLAEAVRRYEARHGESPDAEAFLEELAEEGFVAPHDAELAQAGDGRRKRVWNLDGLSPQAARRWFSAPVAVVAGLVVLTAAVLAFLDPRAIPGSSSLMFQTHFWAYLWVVIAIATIGVVVHELAHVIAARAAGVSARMTIGNQMYAIVAQTDMTGIWLAPKRARYLALVAGMIVDVVGAALLFIVVWLDRAGVLTLAGPVRTVLAGVLFTYFIRLLWQTFVFLRTDLYYVIATALDTRSLMADTGVYLRNVVRRVRRRPLIDQTGIGRREMRAIRIFSVVWVLGRLMSLATLFGLTIPLILFYGGRVVAFFTGEPISGSFTWADILAFALLTFLLDFGGIVMWVRALIRSSRARRRAPDRVLVE